MAEIGIKPKKHLGQHFLGDETIAHEIAAHIVGSNVLEIGPGLGILTSILSKKVRLTAIELDEELVKILRKKIRKSKIVCGDALKADYSQYEVICGLLPYNISSQIIEKFIKSKSETAVFVIQKELAERIVAKAGTKEYSRFSVLCQNNCECKILATYEPTVFWPVPKVKSALVELKKKSGLQLNASLINALFQHKNQKVKKALKHSSHLLGKKVMSLHSALLNRRVVTLTIEELSQLSKEFGA